MRRRLFLAIGISCTLALGSVAVLAQGPQPHGVTATLGSGFTYQGQLQRGGAPYSGACNLLFSLWDAQGSGAPPTGGTRIGVTQTVSAVSVSNGIFTVMLNNAGQFGASAFNGQARWLQGAVQCGADSGYTTLSRQPLSAAPYALYSMGNWGLSGNAGTDAANFLGTTDNMTLTLGVSNTTALRLVPAPDAPIIIGGYVGNRVSGNADGATIGGGGSSVFGGNVISGSNVTRATIAGGMNNRIVDLAYQATIGGGYSNTVRFVNGTVSGGSNNTASGSWSTVSGGDQNTASAGSSTVSGGNANTASGYASTVSGGQYSTASGNYSTVSGGAFNTASGDYSTVSGGNNTASGYASTVSGASNIAQGNFSFAAGSQARAVHNGVFVWADRTLQVISSTVPNQFVVRATGGISLVTSVDGLGNPSGSFSVSGPGNAAQSLDSGGLVKAMVHFQSNSIVGCYNAQASPPSTSIPCGFSLSTGAAGVVTVTFGFKVDDRFVSVTPHYDSDTAIMATVSFPSATQVKVRTFDAGGALIGSAFFLEVH